MRYDYHIVVRCGSFATASGRGLSFTVSTLALAVNVGIEGGIHVSTASETIVALGLACIGMWIGQVIRLRLSPAVFRTWIFVALLLLGLYLFARSMV